jgi:hypothetical protein
MQYLQYKMTDHKIILYFTKSRRDLKSVRKQMLLQRTLFGGQAINNKKAPLVLRGERDGSGSWARTSDQVVNSHLLYH